MYFPLLYSLRIILLVFLVSCGSFLQLATACNNQSLESCSTSKDCAGEDGACIRVSNSNFLECRSGKEPDCLCAPSAVSFKKCPPSVNCPVIPSLTSCSSDEDCRQLEVCARSKMSGTMLCVGCLRATDPQQNDYDIVDKSSSRCKTPRPPCGQTLDLCSDSLSCSPALQCLTIENGDTYTCMNRGPCQCMTLDMLLSQCDTDDDCNEPREVCALNTYLSRKECVACDAAKYDQFFKIVDSDACKGVTSLPLPDYALANNGLSYDYCRSDIQCNGDRTCVQYRDTIAPRKGTIPCPMDTTDGFCFCKGVDVKCKNSSECPVGEICVDVSRLDISKTCVSMALLADVPSPSRKVYGKREIKEGTNLTNDPCMYDWDCSDNRRCTHFTEQYGGCAGRRACFCKPLVHSICESDSECVSGETCAKTIDSRADAFCVSRNFVAENDYLQAPSFEPPASTPLYGNGLTSEPCRTSDDCTGKGLDCYHKDEIGGSCDGREWCQCKNVQNLTEQFTACRKSADCVDGEVCADVMDSVPSNLTCIGRYAFEESTVLEEVQPRPTPLPSISATTSATPSTTSSVSPAAQPSPTISAMPSTTAADGDIVEPDSTICIDASLLNHLSVDELVFASARRGAVLCDVSGSCATAGHMVTWRGKAMSMWTYCQNFSNCTRRVAWVNSPRMHRGLRVRSKTEGLQFTALAARYESWLEEALLTRLLQFGV